MTFPDKLGKKLSMWKIDFFLLKWHWVKPSCQNKVSIRSCAMFWIWNNKRTIFCNSEKAHLNTLYRKFYDGGKKSVYLMDFTCFKKLLTFLQFYRLIFATQIFCESFLKFYMSSIINFLCDFSLEFHTDSCVRRGVRIEIIKATLS